MEEMQEHADGPQKIFSVLRSRVKIGKKIVHKNCA